MTYLTDWRRGSSIWLGDRLVNTKYHPSPLVYRMSSPLSARCSYRLSQGELYHCGTDTVACVTLTPSSYNVHSPHSRIAQCCTCSNHSQFMIDCMSRLLRHPIENWKLRLLMSTDGVKDWEHWPSALYLSCLSLKNDKQRTVTVSDWSVYVMGELS